MRIREIGRKKQKPPISIGGSEKLRAMDRPRYMNVPSPAPCHVNVAGVGKQSVWGLRIIAGTLLSLWHHFANSSIAKQWPNNGPKWLCERSLALTPRGKARSLIPRFELHDCRTTPTTIDFRQHSLYFWPLPHGQGSFRPNLLFPSPFSNVGHAAGFPESRSHVVHFRVLAPRIVQRRQLVEDCCSFSHLRIDPQLQS
jgi:hypothetical protein